MVKVSNDAIIPINHLGYEDNQKLIIFDDYVCEKNQRQIVDYFIQGRHKNCSVIYLSQSFYKTPRDIRHETFLYVDKPRKKVKRNFTGELLICNLKIK